MNTDISLHAVNVSNKYNIWLNGTKNVVFTLLFFVPLVISIIFDLSNVMYGISLLTLIISPVFFLLFRVGSDTILIFMHKELTITDRNRVETISVSDIDMIDIVKFSGSRAPFVIKLKTNNAEMSYLVDKFKFQNPSAKLRDLSMRGEWANLLSRRRPVSNINSDKRHAIKAQK